MAWDFNVLVILVLLVALAGLGVAALFMWRDHARLRRNAEELDAALLEAREARTRAEERVRHLEEGQAAMETQFAATSAKVLEQASQAFLRQAEEKFKASGEKNSQSLEALVKPMRETLAQFDTHTRAIEAERQKAYGALQEHLNALKSGLEATHTSTTRLTEALRGSSQVRGRWGEESLKTVLGQVGMTQHIAYETQAHMQGEGGAQRPDVVVNLPGGGKFVIDAKTPLSAYFDALEAPDEAAKALAMKRHAGDMRTHMKHLSSKRYMDALEFTPDIVAMFVPGENFMAAALEADSKLYEDAFGARVILVTPSTLFALLKSVAYGWRLEDQAKNAREVADLGRELYKRIAKMGDDVAGMGKQLDGAMRKYNEFVGTLERRVLPQARKFEDLGVDHEAKELKALDPLETTPRALSKLEP